VRHESAFPGEGAAFLLAGGVLAVLGLRAVVLLCEPEIGGGAAVVRRWAPIDINAASAEDLTALPGVGPARARAVVEYRRTHGPFRRVEDLVRVPGFGPRTVEKIRPMVRCGP